jgi:IMP dehydrogenase
MMGTMLAGTTEAPGEFYLDEKGVRVKKHRGMGSEEAMKQGSSIRYGSEKGRRVPQGVVSEVVDKGSAYEFLFDLEAALKQALQYYGYKNVKSMHNGLYNGKIKFERLSLSAQGQSGAYGLYSIKQPKLLR